MYIGSQIFIGWIVKLKKMYFQSFVIYTIILLELKLQHMNTDWAFDIILGWTGMQLIFFIADHTVVCFEFVI